MRYLIEHTVLYNLHEATMVWHLLAVLVLLVVVFICHKNVKKMKDEEETLENQLSSQLADTAVAAPGANVSSEPASATKA